MRFFIALEIPDQNRRQIEVIQSQIKSLVPEAKLTNPDKLHLTIAFVGDQPKSLLEPLTDLLKTATKDIPPFSITPAYLDGFPTLHRAHILWLGVKGDIDKLFILQERIKDGLLSLGLSADLRRFTPHIAIAKIQNFHLSPDLEKSFQALSIAPEPPIPVTSLKLFESIPNHDFHTHNTLAEIKLK